MQQEFGCHSLLSDTTEQVVLALAFFFWGYESESFLSVGDAEWPEGF